MSEETVWYDPFVDRLVIYNATLNYLMWNYEEEKSDGGMRLIHCQEFGWDPIWQGYHFVGVL